MILTVEHVFTWQQNVNAGNMSDTLVGVINLLYLILNRLNFHIVIYSTIFWDAHAVVPHFYPAQSCIIVACRFFLLSKTE